jgi:hypothetical protein
MMELPMEKSESSLTIQFSADEIRRIERCAKVERKSPDEWSRRTLDYVARRITKVVGEGEE